MAHYKYNHYVPKGHLKNFSARSTYAIDDSLIFRFCKDTGKVKQKEISNVGGKNCLYDVSGTDPKSLEKKLGNFETNIPSLTSHIVAATRTPDKIKLGFGHKEMVAFWMALQLVRSPENIENLLQMADNLREQLAEDISLPNAETEKDNTRNAIPGLGPSFPVDEVLASLPKHREEARQQFARGICDGDFIDYVEAIRSHHLWIMVNSTKKKFYISDNPVTVHCVIPREGRGCGLASLSAEVHMPLTSRVAVSLVEPSFASRLGFADGHIFSLKKRNVEHYNSLQVLRSLNEIYCEDDDFDLIRDMIAKNPDLADKERKRFASADDIRNGY